MLHPLSDNLSDNARVSRRGVHGEGRPVSFATDTREKTGEDDRRTREHLARAEALGPDIHAVVGTSLDKGVELDALVKMKPEERRDLVRRAQAGEQVSAKHHNESKKDPQQASRMVEIIVGDFARMLDKVTPEDVAEAMVKQAIFSVVHKAWLENMASWGGMKGDAETMRTQCERNANASKTHDGAKTPASLPALARILRCIALPKNNKDAMMAAWSLSFYNAKVAALVEAWPVGVLASFERIARTMQEHGPDLGMPHTRAMGGGLFEVRAKGREGIGRAFYCTVVDRRIVILHAIVKKTEKTPQSDLETARARLKEMKP